MERAKIDLVLWAVGFCLNLLLTAILIGRRRPDTEPWFRVWISFNCISTAVLFIVYRMNTPHVYFHLFWWNAFVDLVLQLRVVVEIASAVMQRGGRWVPGTQIRFWGFSAVSLVVAVALSVFATPAARTVIDSTYARASLFMTVLFCLMFGIVVRISWQFGLKWNTRAARVSFGLAVWNLMSFLTDTLHVYWRTANYFDGLEHVRIITMELVVIYWIVIQFVKYPAVQSTAEPVLPELTFMRDLARLRTPRTSGKESF